VCSVFPWPAEATKARWRLWLFVLLKVLNIASFRADIFPSLCNLTRIFHEPNAKQGEYACVEAYLIYGGTQRTLIALAFGRPKGEQQRNSCNFCHVTFCNLKLISFIFVTNYKLLSYMKSSLLFMKYAG